MKYWPVTQSSTSRITTVQLVSVMTLSFLDCNFYIAFCSLIFSLEYFNGRDFLAFSWISLRVASINISILWWLLVGIQFLFVGFLNLYSSEERFLFFFILKWAWSFVCLKKYSRCLFIISLLTAFCVRKKLKFLFKILKVHLKNILSFRLISCPAESNWNLILSSRVFCDLIKLSRSVRWSLWW